MKITLVISSMKSGGAERVMSLLANFWTLRGEEITLISVDSRDTDFYHLEPSITRVGLSLLIKSPSTWSAIKNNLLRIIRLRMELKNSSPDVIVSFMDTTSVLTLISSTALGIPVVVSEHIDPRQLPPPGVWSTLRRWMYLRANAVVVLTSELRSVVSEFVPVERIHVIPNPATKVWDNPDLKPPFELPRPFVVAMGRLNKQKGFDLLLEAFSRCQDKTWSLVILGEGPERENLQALIQHLNIESRVSLPGNIADPSSVLRHSELFVLSSRFEGFPMALVEAMSCGLPVISFDCPTGPSDIVRDGYDGVLVPPGDVVAITCAMNRLMEDGEERSRLSKPAREVTERFSIERVIGMWDKLLQGLS